MGTDKVRVPEWAADAIWYQIFPERFRNGDVRNDPRVEDVSGQPVPGWSIMPWGHDWYAQRPWERRRGDFFKSVYLRRFGGDLAGLREKLDYLQDLGITALYLNPVFKASSLHKYDADALHHIDPSFGPDRAGDLAALAAAHETEDPATWIWTAADRYFLDLVQEIHRRGLRVLLDGVFNHTGRGFFAFQDLLHHGRASRYADWYKIKTWHPDGTFAYDGWFGHQALPEFAQRRGQLALPVREYLYHVTRRWMDPDGDGDPRDGIDGWRLDVAFCLPHAFWKGWRRHVKRINAQAYLTAEIVTLAGDYLQGDEFDAVMNYAWLYPTYNFFAPMRRPIAASKFRREMKRIAKAYPPEVAPVLQNLLDSHDVARMVTMLANCEEPILEFSRYFELGRAKDRPDLDTRQPSQRSYDILRQMIVFQMTYVGAPMLYYGTEVGLWGANDPCDRQPMLWEDRPAQGEDAALGGSVALRPRRPDLRLHAFYRDLIRLRRAHPALRRGKLTWVATGHERLLGYRREGAGERILVLLNASDRPLSFDLKRPARLLTGEGGTVRAGRLGVKARGWRVLLLSC